MNSAEIRFYEELNDFLPRDKKKRDYTVEFNENPSVKDLIESQGIPHIEVDLILVNSESVTFGYQVQNGDHISVYPVFESLDIRNVTRLRKEPLREPRFILDVHLGKLARLLRLLGFDTLYQNNFHDEEIAEISAAEERIVLSRDIGLLKRSIVTRGYWLRSQDPEQQLEELIRRFDLENLIKPFRFCLSCNGSIIKVEKEKIEHLLEEQTKKSYNDFFQCSRCQKVFWKGSHFEGLMRIIKKYNKQE